MTTRITIACLCLTAVTTQAGELPVNSGKVPVDAIQIVEAAPRATFTLGFGYLDVKADEVVYGGPGNNNELSHLIWDSEGVLTIDLGLSYDITNRLSIFSEGIIGLADDSHMVDYDYLGD